ncbi:tryparedoxin-dependent peroxidase [Perkinsela sp. CCAP 1560/4]|nr:tryparedoxin-dependent peroxidase [Perkinsela sp. CCAP 1560/4]|eukprot:KNH07933.1 tryparedoxin-dependent peroxidase [Perkinsela sp. CCAP 1560/4]
MSLKQTVFDFTVKDAANKDLSLCLYKGKALLIMNVASKCGFTQGGYTTANELLRKYKSVGFDVLAFPCNQFAKQEPGDAASIQKFACEIMKAEFDILSKIDVNGSNASPLWEFLKESIPGVMGTKAIKWNFTMFLCDRDGVPRHRYSPGTKTEEIEKDLQKLI